MEFGEPADRLGLAQIIGQNLGIDRRSPGGVAFGGRFLGLGQQRRQFVLERTDEPLDEAADLAFWQRADKSIHRLPLVEGDHGRNRLDAELARDLGMVVDVHLDQGDLAARSRRPPSPAPARAACKGHTKAPRNRPAPAGAPMP